MEHTDRTLIAEHSITSDEYDKITAFIFLLMKGMRQVMSQSGHFRLTLDYDAGMLNTYYLFFTEGYDPRSDGSRTDAETPEEPAGEPNVNTDEGWVGRGFVKTAGFESAMQFISSLTTEMCGIMRTHKSFHMELDYDAEALDTKYFFYAPSDPQGADDIPPEC